MLSPPLASMPSPSSPFGVDRGESLHNGTDWPAPIGTPLLAMSSGRVRFRLFPPDKSGNAVGVDADDGRTQWSFSHLDDVDVNVGDVVQRGQVIGTVGMTGNTTGPHVHVVTRVDGELVDPETLLSGGGSLLGSVVALAAIAGAAALVARAGGSSFDSVIDDAVDFLDALQRERDRLALERAELIAARTGQCLLFPFLCLLDPAELGTRVAVLDGLLGQVDNFVADVFVRVERKAKETQNLEVAMRLREATARILAALDGTSATQELSDDVTKFVRDTVDELKTTAQIGGGLFAAGLGVVLGLWAVNNFGGGGRRAYSR